MNIFMFMTDEHPPAKMLSNRLPAVRVLNNTGRLSCVLATVKCVLVGDWEGVHCCCWCEACVVEGMV